VTPRAHVVLSGSLCAGKSTLAMQLVEICGYTVVAARETLRALAPHELSTRSDLQSFGSSLERSTRGRWMEEPVAEALRHTGGPIVVDSVRTSQQLTAVSGVLGTASIHVALTARREVLEERFLARREAEDSRFSEWSEAVAHDIEANVDKLQRVSDVVLDTSDLEPGALLTALVAGWRATGRTLD
jgi:adenylosuccinate synthase